MIVEGLFLLVLVLLIHSYLLYPLLAIVIGAGRSQSAIDDLPAVSVLVPAYNEASVIQAKIENFRNLDYPADRLELVIADDGSTDETVECVQQYPHPRIRLIQNPKRSGKAATMNHLVEAAQHDLLLFSDANVMFANNVVRRLVNPLGHDEVGAVTGEVRLIDSDREFSSGEELYYIIERRIQGAESRIGSVMGVDGGMYLIRRELFETLPTDTILDDFLVSIRVMRAGRQVVYEPAAQATESGTPSARQEFARRTRIAAGAVQLLKRGNVPRLTQPILWGQFISHKLLRWISPGLLLLLLIINGLLITNHPLYVASLLFQLVILLAILLTWWIPLLRRNLIGSVLFYFGISQAAMALGLLRGCFNRQAAQWDKGQRLEHGSDSTSGANP